MNGEHIDFISAYCDRWCERCAFTSRCSTFAAEAAIAMCGDVAEGLTLAVGRPHAAGPDARPPEPPWVGGIDNVAPTEEEMDACERDERARRARIEATPTATRAWAFSTHAHRWSRDWHESLLPRADDVLREALAIVLHDAFFITVKLYRTLDGWDRHDRGEEHDEHPVQNDWNGSAKVALISIERSSAAWRVIAEATGDPVPADLAAQLEALRIEVERQFPRAQAFVRPGFDER